MKLLLLLLFFVGCSQASECHVDDVSACETHDPCGVYRSKEAFKVLNLCINKSGGYKHRLQECYRLYLKLRGKK